MYCKYCGNKIDEDAVFCPSCGKAQTKSLENKDNGTINTDSETKKLPPIVKEPTLTTANRPAESVTFFEAIKNFYVNFFNFQGRAVRSEYWWEYLYQMFITVIFLFLPETLQPLSYAWSIIHLIPGIALTIRRLHDVGKSGAYWFLWLIPIIGALILIFYLCEPSDADNEWGLSPYEPRKPRRAYNSDSTVTHRWLCVCGESITSLPCPYCGRENKETEKIPDGYWKCMGCGEYVSCDNKECECGYVNSKIKTVPYWCENCGYEGPYGDRCPKCESSIKRYNVDTKSSSVQQYKTCAYCGKTVPVSTKRCECGCLNFS